MSLVKAVLQTFLPHSVQWLIGIQEVEASEHEVPAVALSRLEEQDETSVTSMEPSQLLHDSVDSVERVNPTLIDTAGRVTQETNGSDQTLSIDTMSGLSDECASHHASPLVSPDSGSVFVHGPTGFEYRGYHMGRLYQWAFEVLSPCIVPLGFSIVPREHPDDFAIVDTSLREPRIIGYVQIVLTHTIIRVQLLPKGLRHMNVLLSKLNNNEASFVVREVRALAMFKRIQINVPMEMLECNLTRIVRIVRALRFTYFLSYWNQNALKDLYYLQTRASDHQTLKDDQNLLYKFKRWANSSKRNRQVVYRQSDVSIDHILSPPSEQTVVFPSQQTK